MFVFIDGFAIDSALFRLDMDVFFAIERIEYGVAAFVRFRATRSRIRSCAVDFFDLLRSLKSTILVVVCG